MIADAVREKIETIEPTSIFSYSDFSYLEKDKLAVAKALSNLFKKGILKRISKGMYYKPSYSRFGELSPTDTDIINKFLELTKKNIAYLSGTNIYRKMGLTTQLSKEYVIVNDTKQGIIEIQNITIRFMKTPVLETVKDISYLQLLDAIADIKNISGTTPSKACEIILSKIKAMTFKERKELVKLGLYYKPMTRALLGAIVDLFKEKELSLSLKNTLNPLTSFQIGISEKVLPNKSQWHIQ